MWRGKRERKEVNGRRNKAAVIRFESRKGEVWDFWLSLGKER